jgi:hypothetical protein
MTGSAATGHWLSGRRPQTRPRAAFTAEPARRQECHAQISRFGTACALAIYPGRQLQVGGSARSLGDRTPARRERWLWAGTGALCAGVGGGLDALAGGGRAGAAAPVLLPAG